MNVINKFDIAHLDLQQLRMFFVLCQVGSYTEAAKRVFRTQPAVSHAVRKLEESVGARLIDKKGRAFTLTEEGRRLFEACETAFYALESASEAIANAGGRSGGRIRIGSTVEFGSSVLARHMAIFARANPEVNLELTLDDDLLPPLLRDDLDLVVDCREHNLPELVQDVLFRESYDVVCAPSYKEEKGLARPADLSDCVVISTDAGGTWWNRFFLSLPIEERPSLEAPMIISHIRGVIVAVSTGLGVALVPRYSVLSELEEGTLISLFPSIRIMEDRFSIYQKRARAELKRNALVTEFLKAMKPSEFG